MTTVESSQPASGKRGLFWAFLPVALLTASVVGVGSAASIAMRDPGFALEKNYYDRAVHWDGEQAQAANNARLGYHLALAVAPAGAASELVVRLTDRGGAPLSAAVVQAEAFANARSADRRALSFTAAPDGTYRALLVNARPGLWEFRFDVHALGEHFTELVRTDVGEAGQR
jgi:nitrogen fixation protein FixH